MNELLPSVQSPKDLLSLTDAQLERLAQEMRDELVRVCLLRPAHFASNLGVVELCLALHLTFDFSRDRLVWDTGHQIYPHKLITGRFSRFETIRTRGGLMGYPNPAESPYDLFVTGHAGCSVSCALGLKVGDDLRGEPERHSVAVIGDGALPSGIAFEALNNAGWVKKNLLVILNDNEMSICPRVGALAQYLDRIRGTPLGRLFEEVGFRHVGPVDGHDLPQLRRRLQDVKRQQGPILLHVLTRKGQGVPQACEDPVKFHTPPVIEEVGPDRSILSLRRGSDRACTDAVAAAIHAAMREDRRVCTITAAMCQGNKLEKVRKDFPDRFFDVGICESHAVAFAAGLARAGMRPVVAIYSTFLQRSFDQLFQEVTLQNLPVTFTLDRSGLTGPDGPTHHGAFDIAYLRIFPNMMVMAPGDEQDIAPMLQLALNHAGPAAIRYPKANLERVAREPAPVVPGTAEVLAWGEDVILVAFGTLLPACVQAAEWLRRDGLSVGVINARFVKPLDRLTLVKAIETAAVVVTVEEGCLAGGFGSAVLEAAQDAGVDNRGVVRLGLPDRFIEHGERDELLASVGLTPEGIAGAARCALEKLVPIGLRGGTAGFAEVKNKRHRVEVSR